MPDGTERKRLAPWRLDTIYRTNIQSAYSAGRYKQMMEVAAHRPYWQYMAIMDAKTRSTHAAQNGKVYDYRHPFWDKWYPPAGFNCRCYVKSLSPEDVKARGLEVETRGTDLMPDEGWDYNVGEEFLSWDRTAVTPAFRAAEDQKTFRDFGRPDVRDVPPELRLTAPEQIPTASEVGFDRSFELVLRAVGIEPGMEYSLFQTADGDLAYLHPDKIKHLFDAGDGREKYAGFIVPTLKDPFEIYLTEYTDGAGTKVQRKRYIGLFSGEGKRDYIVILDQGRDGSIFWNAFTREKSRINKARVGELIYAQPV